MSEEWKEASENTFALIKFEVGGKCIVGKAGEELKVKDKDGWFFLVPFIKNRDIYFDI